MRTLDSSIAEKILPLYQTGITQAEVADRLGISISTVNRHIAKSGYDRTHVGGALSRRMPKQPIATPKAAPESEPLVVTGRTLNLRGTVTGCNYIAGTHNDNVDITLDDWMICIPRDALGGFIDELQHIRKLIGA